MYCLKRKELKKKKKEQTITPSYLNFFKWNSIVWKYPKIAKISSILLKILKNDGYQRGLASMIYIFFK